MTRIIQGVFDFQRRIFGKKKELFNRLGKGQSPHALFITCSDSRINPNLLTQTGPGELFILRNAGNLVPATGSAPNGEEATIEYAVVVLKVRDIILCGHSKCGAMHGLLTPAALHDVPKVAQWLTNAHEILPYIHSQSKTLPPDELLNLTIERNVVLQLEHLKTHPPVAAALAAGKLRLHGWVYYFESGKVLALDFESNRFVPLAESFRQHVLEHVPGGEEDFTGEYDTWI